MATLGGVRTREQVEAGVATLSRHWDEHGFGPWIARNIESSEFVGLGGLRWVTVEETPEVEVGYALIPAFWRQGLATELATMAAHVGFDVLRLPTLVSFSLPTNLSSRRVMEKAGFRYERDFVYKGFPQVLYRHHRGQMG
jgi:ribosomal-protein-alanine N-acetyltransferase